MTRRYGPIGTGVWESQKFLALENDTHRLGYLYLIACPHGNSLGVFRLPLMYFAADRRIGPDVAKALLDDLANVGLIEVGDEDFIRVNRWFFNDTGANSPSTASSFCKVFKDRKLVRPGPLRTRALVEMVVATLLRAENWNPDSKPFSQMLRDVQSFVIAEYKADPEGVKEAFHEYDRPGRDTVLHTMLDTVSHMVSDTVLTWGGTYEHEHGQRETDTETDNGQRTTGNGQRTTGGSSEMAGVPPSDPPSTPAGGSRSGRGKVSEETQRAIDSIGKCDACGTKLGYGDCPQCKSIKR